MKVTLFSDSHCYYSVGLSTSTPEQQGKEQIDVARQPHPTVKQLSGAPKATNQHGAAKIGRGAGKSATENNASK